MTLQAASFPSLKDDTETIMDFLNSVGLDAQLFEFAAEAVCETVHQEDANADIADLVLGVRNNAAFKAIVLNGADFGVFQHRSRGGKACITNTEKSLMIMVHNTDEATALGAHIPRFMSKRRRPGTSYVHSEEQCEFDLVDDVDELGVADGGCHLDKTKIDVCVFAEKKDGTPICRIELLVDAQLDDRGNEFVSCKQRFGMKFKGDDFMPVSSSDTSDIEDFDDLIIPRRKK